MGYKVVYSNESLENIEAIYDYIAKDDYLRAEKFVSKIFSDISLLEKFPNLGSVDESTDKRKLIKAPYIIYYSLSELNSTIEIYSIRHGARAKN